MIIIDRNLKLKKKLKIFNNIKKRKIFLYTSSTNSKKISYFKKKGIKIIYIKSLKSKKDFENFFIDLKKRGYSRIFIESGLTFINFLINNNFLNYIYIFKSKINLKKNGINYSSSKTLKKITLKNMIKVNLYDDKLYMEKLK